MIDRTAVAAVLSTLVHAGLAVLPYAAAVAGLAGLALLGRRLWPWLSLQVERLKDTSHWAREDRRWAAGVRNREEASAAHPARESASVGDEPIRTTWRSYLAEVPAWAIVIGAMAVSFWTQVVQVQHYGFAFWEALIWGSSTDFGTLACLFLAREGVHRGTPTWGAWVLSVACAVMSAQFNIVAGIEAHDWLAIESHVWMPALALGVWYWTLHGRHRRWTLRGSQLTGRTTGDEEVSTGTVGADDAQGERITEASQTSGASHRRRPTRHRPARRPAGEVLELVRVARIRLRADLGREPGDEEIAARVSADGHPITASRVRSYLAQLRAEERAHADSSERQSEQEVVAWHAS